jgi:Zn-dependent M28 family amino/carboxypeptidase
MARLLYGALLLACAWPAAAQTSGAPSVQDRLKADVTFLADDLLEGRGNGSKGYDIAARYVASRFQGLGLKPGFNGSYIQPVTFSETTLKRGAAAFLTIDNQRFENAVDVLIAPSPLFPDQTISGETVFVGYGIDAPQSGFDDYRGLDVRGKIVVALWGFPPGTPSEMGAHLASDKARMAQERGALGLLTIHTPTYETVYPWADQAERLSRPYYSWVGPDGRPYSSAPDLKFAASLGPKATQALFAGSGASLDRIFADSRKPNAKVKGFALKPRLTAERHAAVKTITSPNVVAILPGSDPTLSAEVIGLTGHLDAIGIVPPVNGDSIVNGAMDNASGIASMLEVAREFVTSGNRPKRTLMFAALAAEEVGLLGSSYLAHNPVVSPAKIVGLVNLDMPTLSYDFTDVVAYGAEHSTIGATVARAIATENVTLAADPEPDQLIFVRTDHYNFVKVGVPAVSLDTGPGNGGQAAAEKFGKERYHEPSDDINQPFNWDAAAKFVRLNYLVASELANAPEPPRWYEKDFFGDTFAKGEPKAKR